MLKELSLVSYTNRGFTLALLFLLFLLEPWEVEQGHQLQKNLWEWWVVLER